MVREHLSPNSINDATQHFGVLPTGGKGRKAIAHRATIERPKLGDGKDLASALVSGEPRCEGLFKEREPSNQFGKKFTFAVRDGYLAVMAVQRAKMKLVRALDELRVDKQAFPMRRIDMLHDRNVREILSDS